MANDKPEERSEALPEGDAGSVYAESKRSRTPRICPKCGVADIRPSHPRSIFDLMMAWFGRAPFRCRSCWKRFYVYSPDSLRALEEARRQGKAPR
jgi:hypothetical protein